VAHGAVLSRSVACGGGTIGIGLWRSLEAHLLWEQGVVSSNLTSPTGTPLGVPRELLRNSGKHGSVFLAVGNAMRSLGVTA
jgi:hypothetical protein